MATNVAAALKNLLPKEIPPSLRLSAASLYEVLARYPNDGVGIRVHQTRWTTKNIGPCYWEVTRTKLKCEGKHGKAWGKLVWRGAYILQMCFPVQTHVVSVDDAVSHVI